jgi:hypothetical protein
VQFDELVGERPLFWPKSDVRIHLLRAMSHQQLGQTDKAQEWFDRANRWIERQSILDMDRPDFFRAGDRLGAEVLRRRARALIYGTK